MRKLIIPFVICLLFSCKDHQQAQKDNTEIKDQNSEKPNIVILYVDDLGYADVGSYGAKGVETPNIDRMAANGVKFTDAHSSAATCTPSRYSLLTGNYAFRNKAAILPGDAPLLIDTSQVTLPKMLKKAGYTTGVVGKWHLGLGIGKVNWNEEISPGANEVGFDYSFLLPATGDRVPTVFVEDGKVVNLDENDPITVSYDEKVGDRPTGTENPDQLKFKADLQHSNTIVNGVSRIGYMAGGKEAEWVDENFPFDFNKKAKEFMKRNKENPFFLYYSFHDIHVPRVPNARFQGKSSMGARGDAIAQVDFVVGEIMKELEELNIADNTIIVFTSDNGPVLDDGYDDKAEEMVGEHNPSGPFRGGKYSIYEAGTRVPTIVYWPGKVKPTESDALMNQLDLYASFASLVNQPLPEDVIDSEDHMDAWLGETKNGREEMLEEGFTLALRDGKWKYIQPFNGSIPDWMANKDIESGLSDKPQLYNLEEDKAEQNNLAEENPDLVNQYEERTQEIITKTE
ncbi:sulfatase family protein [Christiangramia crocea]|uniref:Arylsulfatase n=1 Tax=Christiangramia crocea TaxID=2904124 RepID=A0A9X2A7H7_9FLAO|nr:arylsulfatase [Gramella crocea]MCG9973095.1 arylsulfatase [Gramella crocea]